MLRHNASRIRSKCSGSFLMSMGTGRLCSFRSSAFGASHLVFCSRRMTTSVPFSTPLSSSSSSPPAVVKGPLETETRDIMDRVATALEDIMRRYPKGTKRPLASLSSDLPEDLLDLMADCDGGSISLRQVAEHFPERFRLLRGSVGQNSPQLTTSAGTLFISLAYDSNPPLAPIATGTCSATSAQPSPDRENRSAITAAQRRTRGFAFLQSLTPLLKSSLNGTTVTVKGDFHPITRTPNVQLFDSLAQERKMERCAMRVGLTKRLKEIRPLLQAIMKIEARMAVDKQVREQYFREVARLIMISKEGKSSPLPSEGNTCDTCSESTSMPSNLSPPPPLPSARDYFHHSNEFQDVLRDLRSLLTFNVTVTHASTTCANDNKLVAGNTHGNSSNPIIRLYAFPKEWEQIVMSGYGSYKAQLDEYHRAHESYLETYGPIINRAQADQKQEKSDSFDPTHAERHTTDSPHSLCKVQMEKHGIPMPPLPPKPPKTKLPFLEGLDALAALERLTINPSAFVYFACITDGFQYLQFQKCIQSEEDFALQEQHILHQQQQQQNTGASVSVSSSSDDSDDGVLEYFSASQRSVGVCSDSISPFFIRKFDGNLAGMYTGGQIKKIMRESKNLLGSDWARRAGSNELGMLNSVPKSPCSSFPELPFSCLNEDERRSILSSLSASEESYCERRGTFCALPMPRLRQLVKLNTATGNSGGLGLGQRNPSIFSDLSSVIYPQSSNHSYYTSGVWYDTSCDQHLWAETDKSELAIGNTKSIPATMENKKEVGAVKSGGGNAPNPPIRFPTWGEGRYIYTSSAGNKSGVIRPEEGRSSKINVCHSSPPIIVKPPHIPIIHVYDQCRVARCLPVETFTPLGPLVASAKPLTDCSVLQVLLSAPHYFRFEVEEPSNSVFDASENAHEKEANTATAKEKQQEGGGGTENEGMDASIMTRACRSSSPAQTPSVPYRFITGVQFVLHEHYTPVEKRNGSTRGYEDIVADIRSISDEIAKGRRLDVKEQKLKKRLAQKKERRRLSIAASSFRNGLSPLLDFDVAAQALYDTIGQRPMTREDLQKVLPESLRDFTHGLDPKFYAAYPNLFRVYEIPPDTVVQCRDALAIFAEATGQSTLALVPEDAALTEADLISIVKAAICDANSYAARFGRSPFVTHVESRLPKFVRNRLKRDFENLFNFVRKFPKEFVLNVGCKTLGDGAVDDDHEGAIRACGGTDGGKVEVQLAEFAHDYGMK